MKEHNELGYQHYLEESLKFGFIHHIDFKNSTYAPKILLNDPATGQFVLTEIQSEIEKSQSFCINVAFVTEAGIGMLKSQLSDFADRGGKGRLLISPYLGFNHPRALKELLKLKNVEVRMTKEALNSHAKLFLFNHGLDQVAIVGSSNLTHNALKINYEWNIKLHSTNNGDFIQKSQQAFDKIWQDSRVLNLELIENYTKTVFQSVKINVSQIKESLASYSKAIVPNLMQESALEGIEKIRQSGDKRGLIISATGTGKTYLSAFDVRRYQPKKFLFVVHREQILRKAQADYQKVIEFEDCETCIYKSGMDISDKRYVFTTVQTLQQDSNLLAFAPDCFDYILIDEVHKAGAASYQKIINYFEPEFLMGMTATPERTDGFNIYELFDYNIAYEIRLQAALEEDMLCPFLYYGVTDMYQENALVADDMNFTDLIAEDRVNHIIEKIEYYGYSGDHVKGLMFCSSKQEARSLSLLLNHRGYRTVALTGEDSQDVRENYVKQLEQGQLDYILTVDIFNEGIDIPSVNQVVMLRNTESSIIFVQQLGRGLRKHDSKEFVTIIDFIGNYRNNYLIPIALFGDTTMNKDNYRRKVVNRNQLAGITTINFEEIAKKQIFDAISATNYSKMTILKDAYYDALNRLGRTPLLVDYLKMGSIDPVIFFDKTINHYGEFLKKLKNNDFTLSHVISDKILTFISKELLNGMRPHELLLVDHLMDHSMMTLEEYRILLQYNGMKNDEETLRSVARVLSYEFFDEATRNKYGQDFIVFENNHFRFADKVEEALKDPHFVCLLRDVVEAGVLRSECYDDHAQLTIGEKYSRKDACRLLNWDKDESSTMYGYKVKHGTCPIFVTYHKQEDISETTQYGDEFINEQVFHWFTRSKRTLKSEEVRKIVQQKAEGTQVHLFIKKDDADGKDFYYLGQAHVIDESARDTFMPSGEPVVTMDLKLEEPVSYELMQYFVEA